jgi:phospholipase C
MSKFRIGAVAVALGVLGLAGCALPDRPASDADLRKIDTVVVIYAENRSFDHLYGLFPGANGLANAHPDFYRQRDHDGKVLPELILWDSHGNADPRFPRLPNRPFKINAPPIDRQLADMVPSPIHAFFHNIEQINGGRNDMFAAMSNVGGWTMGYFDTSSLKLWQWAKEYTLADNFFMAAYGGSYLNHQWLICACTPRHPDAPESMRARLDWQGKLMKRPDSPLSASQGPVRVFSSGIGGQVSPDGYSVNTTQPPYQPSGIPPAAGASADLADPKGTTIGTTFIGVPLPPQTTKTVGDTLSAKGVSWAWYAGAWNQAIADGRQPNGTPRKIIYSRDPESPNFQPHHQPFNYYARFAPGTADRERHLKDGDDLMKDIAAGTLPSVAFYKPPGRANQHPSYTDLVKGDSHIAEILEKLRAGPQWKGMLVIVTYDENGGFWDHVSPPTGPGHSDRWGPATRIPALIVSPFAKRGFVDDTQYDTTSIIKFVTRRFGLEPLPGVRAKAGDLTGALRF